MKKAESQVSRQANIGPISNWQSRRLFVAPGHSWGDVIARLRREVANGPGSEELVELTEAVSKLPTAGRLFAGTCMFNLVVSDTPDFHSVNGLLHISYKSTQRQFWLHHIGLDERQDCLACGMDDVMDTFSAVVQAKFMIG